MGGLITKNASIEHDDEENKNLDYGVEVEVNTAQKIWESS